MSMPHPQRSAYRDRRINVMLQQSEAEPEAPTAPLGNRQRPATAGRSVSKRSLISISIAVAALCALAMFFLLFRRDASPVAKDIPVRPVETAPLPAAPKEVAAKPETAPPVADAKAAEAPAAALAETSAANPPEVIPERVHFKLGRLAKAQTVAGLSLRVLATNARKGFCSMVIKPENAKASQRSVQVNKPVEIPVENGNAISLLVTGITKSAVSGYVTGG